MRRRTFLSATAGGLLGLWPAGRAVADAPAAGGGWIPATKEPAIVYSPSRQRVAIVDGKGGIIKAYFVSGRKGVPRPGRYRVYSKSLTAFSSRRPELQWKYMVRFTKSKSGNPIGFHQIPVRCVDGACHQVQGPGQVGTALSAGCVRQTPKHAKWLYNWAALGTLVVVTE